VRKFAFPLCLLTSIALLVALLPASGSAAPGAQEAVLPPRLFPETGRTVSGQFLRYWQDHGGLAQQGYPISQEFRERSPETGQEYTVQYFERAVFEQHPENKPPYDVLLSLLGRHLYDQKYPQGAPGQVPNTGPDSRLFPETGKRLGGAFLAYWQSHGGLAQQGYPISDEFTEQSSLDGKPYRVQYFERAVFEWHPENAGTPYEVLLAQLGTYRFQGAYRDGDADGVPDSVDGCPQQKETANFIFDGDGCPDDITTLVDETAYDLNAYWKGEFAAGGATYSDPAAIEPYTRAIRTGCGRAVPDNAFYCGQDNSIYYDAAFLNGMVQDLGDFAPAVVIAHEWGHLVQTQLGRLDNRPLTQVELEADCLAGVWAGHAGEAGGRVHLDPDDLLEGATQMFRAGDYAVDNPGHHGTPEERGAAFNGGLQNGVDWCFSR
jgi:predicted metalloprotease